MHKLLVILIALLLLSGCASQNQAAPATTSPASSTLPAIIQPTATLPVTATPSPTPPALATATSEPRPADASANLMVEQATQGLASKLGIDPQAISLVTLKAVDWPDASLGCPMGNQSYAQVITPGYLIELQVERTIYEFHSDQAGRVVLCGIAPTMEIYQPP